MSSRLVGARVLPGMARLARPCEASDIINCAAELMRPDDTILFQDREDRIGMRQVSIHTETEVYTAALV